MKKRTITIIIIVCIPLVFIASLSYPKFSVFLQKRNSLRALEDLVGEQYPDIKGDYALFVQDLSYPSLTIAIQPDKRFVAASIIKIPILAAALAAIDEGKLSFDEIVYIDKSDIYGGSGIIKGMKIPTKLTFLRLLQLMIYRSDNTATNKVIDILGFDYINEKIKESGLENTVLKRKMMDFKSRDKGIENYTTVADLALILEKIYEKQLINPQLSSIALSFLKDQLVNDRLPRHLPHEVVVAHKTGLERGTVHDAGIVFAPGGDYIICVLTGQFSSYAQAKKFIADVSLLTYNFYE